MSAQPVPIKPLLAIDTSSALCLVGIQDATGNIFQRQGSTAQSHSEELSGLVQSVLLEAGLGAKDLGAIILGKGPGSFTGLRIAYSFVKGLAFDLKCALVEVSSLRMLAEEFLQPGKVVLAVSDARRSEYFSAAYMRTAAGVEILEPEAIRTRAELEELKLRLQSKDQSWQVLLASLDGAADSLGNVFRPENPVKGLLQAGQDCLLSGNSTVPGRADLAALMPAYLRAVAAQTIAERTALKSS